MNEQELKEQIKVYKHLRTLTECHAKAAGVQTSYIGAPFMRMALLEYGAVIEDWATWVRDNWNNI